MYSHRTELPAQSLSDTAWSDRLARACQARRGLARLLWLLSLPLALASARAAHGTCTIERLPDMAVTMEGTVPLVHAQINGSDALFVADSGAFFSMVTPSAAAQFNMKSDPRYLRGQIRGIGGAESAEVVRAKSFAIMGFTLPDVDFVVAGVHLHNAAGLLGQNVFRLGDVEYDLANGVIRIVRPNACKDAPLAYWAAAANKPFSAIDIDFATAREPHTVGVAYLNGSKIRVIFDTGASRSVLTLTAAKHAGITPQSQGVVAADAEHGIGGRAAKTWIARFATFKVGDEEIHNARLRLGEIELLRADMLIGADFFLSHRVYVAVSQHKLYFTYNGGPVFDLETKREVPESAEGRVQPGSPAAAAAPADAGAPQAAPQSDAKPDIRLDQPTDAAGFARRGSASAARGDYAPALADLNRACELAPDEAGYFYQRGMLYRQNGQADLAMADLDQAIKLKPQDGSSLLARATLRNSRHDAAGAAADLEAADRAVAHDSDERLRIAAVYESLDNPSAARVQDSKWIESHPHKDSRMAGVLNLRCWHGALAGQALDQSLADCNAALKMQPKTASFLDSRGLVYLRLGSYDKAIADYDAALRLSPNTPWSLYGRGIAQLRKGQTAQGQADLAAATAQQPKIAARAAKFGITP